MTLEQIAKQWVQNCLDKDYKTRDKDYENISYKGNTIYSYGQHWEIATYDVMTGIFIINDSRCSTSTNNHTSIVTEAIREALTGSKYKCSAKIFELPCRHISGLPTYNPNAYITHANAVGNLKATIANLQEKQIKGRQGSGAYNDRAHIISYSKNMLELADKLNKQGTLV